MSTLNLPEDLTDSQIDELVIALKKHGKYSPSKPQNISEGSSLFIPKIPNFSGEFPIPKGEVSFEVWKFEINCLRKDGLHKETAVTHGARKSLRGEAAKILMNSLGHKATIGEILDKFEGIYGTLETGEELLQQFYNATQNVGESISSWGCRLEDILTKAVSLKKLSESAKNDMLRTKFWSGLQNSILKNAIRYKYENIFSFDELRREVRKMEQELFPEGSKERKAYKVQHQVQTVGRDATLDGSLDGVHNRLTSLEQKLEVIASDAKQRDSKVAEQIIQKIEELSLRLDKIEKGQDLSRSSQSYSRGQVAYFDEDQGSRPVGSDRRGPGFNPCRRYTTQSRGHSEPHSRNSNSHFRNQGYPQPRDKQFSQPSLNY